MSFQIVQNRGEKVTFVGFRRGDCANCSPWIRPWSVCGRLHQ